MDNYHEIENKRDKLDFDIDGIVYKVNDFSMQSRLGSVANAPRWAIAHKFSSNKGVSQILDIEIQVGRTGALTPVAKIKSINMIKKHLKPTKENKGGIISKENFIHFSNIKNIDLKKKEKKVAGNKWYQD